MEIPTVIHCPDCGARSLRHCDPDLYPEARCNWFCCPRSGGCGGWTEITLKRKLGGLKWVIRKFNANMRVIPPSAS